MAPTNTVPMESRYTGSLSKTTICPIAILMAIATGINTHVMVLKSFLILSNMALLLFLGLIPTTPQIGLGFTFSIAYCFVKSLVSDRAGKILHPLQKQLNEISRAHTQC